MTTVKADAHFVDCDIKDAEGSAESWGLPADARYPYIIAPAAGTVYVFDKEFNLVRKHSDFPGASYSAAIANDGRYAYTFQCIEGNEVPMAIHTEDGTPQNITFETTTLSGLCSAYIHGIRFSADGQYIWAGVGALNYTDDPGAGMICWDSYTGEEVEAYTWDTYSRHYFFETEIDTDTKTFFATSNRTEDPYHAAFWGIRNMSVTPNLFTDFLVKDLATIGDSVNILYLKEQDIWVGCCRGRDRNSYVTLFAGQTELEEYQESLADLYPISNTDTAIVNWYEGSTSTEQAIEAAGYGNTIFVIGRNEAQTLMELRKYTVGTNPMSFTQIGDTVETDIPVDYITAILIDDLSRVLVFTITEYVYVYDKNLNEYTESPVKLEDEVETIALRDGHFQTCQYACRSASYTTYDFTSNQSRTIAFPQDWAHLEGEVVQVLKNGTYIGDEAVSGGQITLDD